MSVMRIDAYADEEIQETNENKKPKWQVWEELMETRPQPFQRILQITTDIVNDAKHIVTVYDAELSDVLRAVEISFRLYEHEKKEEASND